MCIISCTILLWNMSFYHPTSSFSIIEYFLLLSMFFYCPTSSSSSTIQHISKTLRNLPYKDPRLRQVDHLNAGLFCRWSMIDSFADMQGSFADMQGSFADMQGSCVDMQGSLADIYSSLVISHSYTQLIGGSE